MRYPFMACKVAAVLLTGAVYPLAQSLPAEWTWENGIVENLQVVILLLAGFANLYIFLRNMDMGFICHMYLWQFVFFLLLAGRELSWGRVFFIERIGKLGPVLMPLPSNIRLVLHVCIAMVIALLLVSLAVCAPWGRILSFNYEIPWLFLAVAAVGSVSVLLAEHCLGVKDAVLCQAVEELSELTVYFAVLNLSAWYRFELMIINC